MELKIYRHQQVPLFGLVLVVTRVRSSALPHLFPDINPISLFGTILHAPLPTSFTIFLTVNVANFTSVKRADVYLTDLLNTFVPLMNNDVDKPERDIFILSTFYFRYKSLSYLTHFW